jgi:hypothetical protein
LLSRFLSRDSMEVNFSRMRFILLSSIIKWQVKKLRF